jgi:hypothetical protein
VNGFILGMIMLDCSQTGESSLNFSA